MPIKYEQFMYPNEIQARNSLEKIPEFKKIVKEVMNLIHEKSGYINCMSGSIKIGKNQLPDIYNLLLPICDKLGIDIPELYLTLDRTPNAFTIGDTEPIIVLTSGLIETMTLPEIQVVLAHECGHILCHHVLYKTMARVIFSQGIFLNNLFGHLIKYSFSLALAYWDRCSEFTADRVSAYFVGSSDLVSDVMMRLAGGTQNLGLKLNKDEFLKQALNYKDFINSSKINKGFELYFNGFNDHPLLAYRAFDVTAWCNSEEFYNIDPTIIVDIPKDLKNIGIETVVVPKVASSHLIAWFKENNPSNCYANIAIHCGICSKDFKYLKKLSINSTCTIYQAIVDEKDKIIRSRLILFSSIESELKNLFINNEGYIIVK